MVGTKTAARKTARKTAARKTTAAKLIPRRTRGPSQLQRLIATNARTMSAIRRHQKGLTAIEAQLGELHGAAKKPEIKDAARALVDQVKELRLSLGVTVKED